LALEHPPFFDFWDVLIDDPPLSIFLVVGVSLPEWPSDGYFVGLMYVHGIFFQRWRGRRGSLPLPTQKWLFMGFPGTFARLKSRLRQMARKKIRCGPNRPRNQASGRSATMVTRTVSRGRYSIKFRSTCNPYERG
jgi:hypothetical protein